MTLAEGLCGIEKDYLCGLEKDCVERDYVVLKKTVCVSLLHYKNLN